MISLLFEEHTMGDQSPAMVITPEDRRAANELGVLLVVSGDDLIREFVDEWEQLTPEQQAEFERVLDQANQALSATHATVNRIEQSMSRCRSTIRKMRESMSAMSDRVARIENALTDGLLD
jgi:septal ring factor EnvC (AmiA/AmiB activator)